MTQQQPEIKGWQPLEDTKTALNVAMLAAQALSAPVEVFLRTRFGSRYFGVPAFLGFIAVPMWLLLWPGEDPRPMTVFWAFYILMQLRARVESAAMVRKGDIVHTRYNGRPRLMSLFRKTPELKLKAVEPWLVMLVGVFLMAVSEALGSYLIAAGFCLALVESTIAAAERARVFQMHDAFLEQQQTAERFRELRRR